MVYGLPERGEPNWDTKLNASIEAVKETAEAAPDVVAADIEGGTGPVATALTASTADKVSTDLADDASDIGGAAAALIGLRTHLIDTDFASLEAALTALADNGTLEVRGTWSRTTAWTVSKPCTIRFTHGGSITVTAANIHGISVTADGVTIENPTLTGNGDGTAGTASAIRAYGTAADPIDRLTIRGGFITEWSRYGIDLSQVTNFLVTGVKVTNVAYCGISGLSAIGGRIENCVVDTVSMPTGFVNAYGIGVSRDSSGDFTTYPRSRDVVIEDNIVRNVPTWEGIDTHAGVNIQIIKNRVYNCLNAIVLTPGKNTGGTDAYAPLNCVVRDNYCDSEKTDGTAGTGIYVIGASNILGTPHEYAEGCLVVGNTVVNHGKDNNGATLGAIVCYSTRGSVVSNNIIISPAYRGVVFYHTNSGCKATGNTIIDVWTDITDDGTTGAFVVRSTYNVVSLTDNILVRGSKSATSVNNRGMYVANDATNVIRLDHTTDLGAATTPLADGGAKTVAEFRARTFKLFGVATTTTAPSAGAGGALPATPAGYMTITVAGVDRKIPYY